jgi:predicted enzyme related to lactoylglutathione lyase
MTTPHGQFVWHELMTADVDAALKFYGEVIGWTGSETAGPNGRYTTLKVGEHGVGGMMELTPAMREGGARPGWLGYVGVEDIEAYAHKAKDCGATVLLTPREIPNVGSFALIADPQGALIYLFQPMPTERAERPAPGTQGLVGWNELHADDWEAAYGFYSAMFAWSKGDTHDMGPAGTYQLLTDGSEQPFGAMYNRDRSHAPHAFWLYYFAVSDIDAAVERVRGAGGEVVLDVMQVPDGNYVANCRDPEGVLFALVGPRP